MSAHLTTPPTAPAVTGRLDHPQRIAAVRAVLALGWAAAFVIAIGDRVPTMQSELPFAAATLLTTYPAIDAIASTVGASLSSSKSARLLRVNAVISALAVVALGITTFGAGAAEASVVFGAWATVSGIIQLVTAVSRRKSGHQLPMIISGALSSVAGIAFIGASRGQSANLAGFGGYMALGAVLYVLWAVRTRRASSNSHR